MEEKQTLLRESKVAVKCMGVLTENTLEMKKDKDGVDAIVGELKIKTDDLTTIPFNVYVSKLKSDKSESKLYKGFETIMNEYKSVADVGEEEATKILVSEKFGTIRPNMYVNQAGTVVTDFKFQSNFYTSNPKNYEAGNEFEVEAFVKRVHEEVVKGEATGRVIVEGLISTYKGEIFPINFVAEADIADAVMSELSQNETRIFFGKFVNTSVEHVREIPMAIGKPKIEKTYEYRREFVITNVSEAEDDEHALPVDVVKAAYGEYLAKLEQMEEEGKSGKKNNKESNGGREFSKPQGTGRKMPNF